MILRNLASPHQIHKTRERFIYRLSGTDLIGGTTLGLLTCPGHEFRQSRAPPRQQRYLRSRASTAFGPALRFSTAFPSPSLRRIHIPHQCDNQTVHRKAKLLQLSYHLNTFGHTGTLKLQRSALPEYLLHCAPELIERVHAAHLLATIGRP